MSALSNKIIRFPLVYIAHMLGAGAGFIFLFQYAWRVSDWFNNVPAYGDTLENAWAVEQVYQSLQRGEFLTTVTAVFHPTGFHLATMSHTPTVLLCMAAVRAVAGMAFAHSALPLLLCLICFAGCWMFIYRYTGPTHSGALTASVAALMYTFTGARFAIPSHINLLWLTSFLPWFAFALEGLRRTHGTQRWPRQRLLLCGMMWGLMIHGALYGLFLGGVMVALLGRDLWSRRFITYVFVIATIALGVASPVIVLYALGAAADQTANWSVAHAQGWAASLNSLFIPHVYHPLPIVRAFAQTLYSGSIDESAIRNWGTLTWALGALGFIAAWRSQSRGVVISLLSLLVVGFALSLGSMLRWNGHDIGVGFFSKLNQAIWWVGATLRPDAFQSPAAPPNFLQGIPMPGYLVVALVPFWESARVLSRYALAGGMGLLPLAAMGLQRLHPILRVAIALLWLVESLPRVTGDVPLPVQGHPAHIWVSQAAFSAGQGIIDLAAPGLMSGGEVAYATLFHHRPTASAVGSSFPQGSKQLWDRLARQREEFAQPGFATLMQGYRVRYVLVHLKTNYENGVWQMIQSNPALRPIQCFEPGDKPGPWHYVICIAEVKELA